ncbi:hypothetical protein CEXT_277871 [Caerostris extrusa]|uniref:Uncharacterized protein n=1 Tax=Caerostris extrusa TaxID=172846 RepID=A0AAV4SK30_CAEEX|nr:hypothetical protein CEXT_277871 [Caerostris extrusa]
MRIPNLMEPLLHEKLPLLKIFSLAVAAKTCTFPFKWRKRFSHVLLAPTNPLRGGALSARSIRVSQTWRHLGSALLRDITALQPRHNFMLAFLALVTRQIRRKYIQHFAITISP